MALLTSLVAFQLPSLVADGLVGLAGGLGLAQLLSKN